MHKTEYGASSMDIIHYLIYRSKTVGVNTSGYFEKSVKKGGKNN